MTILSAMFVSGATAPMAMLGDVVDYDSLKTGKNRSAQYFSILCLLTKGIGAAGSGFAFFILKFFNYDATATVHDASSVSGIQLAMVWVPVRFIAIAAVAIWTFPIDERRQRIIKRRLDSRLIRAKRQGQQMADSTQAIQETGKEPATLHP